MKDKTKRIIARIILSTAIILSLVPLIPIKVDSKENNDDNDKNNLEDFYTESDLKPMPIKESYKKNEFDELILLGEAKCYEFFYHEFYYRNIHIQTNKYFIAPDGYEIWQRYIYDEDNKIYNATNSYICVYKREELENLNNKIKKSYTVSEIEEMLINGEVIDTEYGLCLKILNGTNNYFTSEEYDLCLELRCINNEKYVITNNYHPIKKESNEMLRTK